MLIGGVSGPSYARFAAYLSVPALIATVTVIGVLLALFRAELKPRRFQPRPPAPPVDRKLMALTLTVVAGVVVAFFAGLPMSWSALTGAALVMALSRREPREALDKVDFILLLFFASLFVLVYGVHKEGWAASMHDLFSPLSDGGGPLRESAGFAILTLVASNIFSNVPFVMLARHWVPQLQEVELGWHVLALASTLAGNLTLLGSVANIIVFELARDRDRIRFGEYLKVGVPVTLASLTLGLGALWLEHAWF
jgi:Na+/H+ antiporter NhaD/arsenite permease-like protein